MDKEQMRQTVLAVCSLAGLLFRGQTRIIAAIGVVQLLALNHWDEVWSIYKQDPRARIVTLAPGQEVTNKL